KSLALVSCFTTPCTDILTQSSFTYFICKYQGDVGLIVIKPTCIKSIISMIPH
ncbi:hypothetical protein PAXRUDRAFT_54903, partial [Paxillus rubicundulus Ve08.2h10]